MVQLATHNVRPGSTVVINVPSGVVDDESSRGGSDKDFKTKDFFNEAEQEIEKVFIRNGFRVLSRAKFEAKLRDLRDEARCDFNEYRCLYSSVAPEARPVLDDIKSKYENGKITGAEFADQVKQFKEQMQISSAGKSRQEDEKELTDISEVIRAAQSGDVRADYILQINVFDTKKRLKVTNDLRHNADVRDFINRYPEIKSAFDLPKNHLLSCAIVGAELNAKLIHVTSGEIVWIGQHQLNELSAGVQQISIEMGERTSPRNESAVESFVRIQNFEEQRKARYGKEISPPGWEYTTELIPPTVISGRCENDWSMDSEIRTQLARNVAKELMSTIKVN